MSFLAEKINNEISFRIYKKNLKTFTKHNLNQQEINRLYRWSLYVGINTFIERLVRCIYALEEKDDLIIKKNLEKSNIVESTSYYKTISDASSAYYNNELLNDNLLNKILSIISFDAFEFKTYFKPSNKKNNYFGYLHVFINVIKRRYLNLLSNFINIFFSPDIFYEGDKFFKSVFKVYQRFPDKINRLYKINKKERDNLKKIYGEVFTDLIANYFDCKTKKQSDELKIIFQEWIDKSIPISCLEGLNDKFNYYSKKIQKHKIKKIISATGHWYNENIKVFSILLKRKGGSIIGMHDGIDNYLDYLSYESHIPIQYKSLSQILLTDKYFFWGISNNLEYYNKIFNSYNIETINFGSTYLNSIKKNNVLKKIKSNNIKTLYISGPYRKHMASLEEITPEEHKLHKSNMINFIKKLLSLNENLNLTYKTFMGVDLTNDLFFTELKNYFDNGRIKTTNLKPIIIMKDYDFIIFDMISTGFGEAINQNIISIIFNSQFYYDSASKYGKEINDQLTKSKVVFYDTESGIKAFEKLKQLKFEYDDDTKIIINNFKKDMAYPISNTEFLNKFNKL